MNKKKLIVFYTILFVFFTACSKPKDAVENVFESIQEGNFAQLSRYTSMKTASYFSIDALRKCDLSRAKYKDNEIALVDACLLKVYSDVYVEKIDIKLLSNTEADANVTVKMNGELFFHKWKVFKHENLWKVSIEGKDQISF